MGKAGSILFGAGMGFVFVAIIAAVAAVFDYFGGSGWLVPWVTLFCWVAADAKEFARGFIREARKP